MKRILVLLSMCLVAVYVFGQEDQRLQDGYHIFKYPNTDVVSSEGYIKNGKPEGFWKSYYVTGVKKSEGKRTSFLLDSIWVFYDQSGDTLEKIDYLLGKKNGYYLKYKKDPAEGLYVWSKELYAGDKREGVAYLYYPGGKVQQSIAYSGGKKQGLSKEYDKNGKIITLLEYNNDFLVSRDRINRTDSKGLKQGLWKDFYPSGGVKTEKNYINDQLNGYYKEYDERGKLVLTMLYDNGSIVKSKVEDQPDIEIVNKYDDNGKLVYSGPYRNNIPVGIHREFGPDGKVTNSFIYNDNGQLMSEGIVDEAGNKNGKWKDYFPDGKVEAEGQYNNSRRTGIWKFYNASQKLEQTGSFNNDRPDGLWTWYYNDGSVLREEEYFQGVRDGNYTEYSPTGEIISKGEYLDGEKNGDWKYQAGDVSEEGKYIVGLRDGQWKSLFADGKTMFKGNYIQGNPDGLQIYYYDNGRVKEEQYYAMGIRQKTWKKYDEEGNTLIAITYKDDVEKSINGIKINLPQSNVKLIK
jgi:antitoxin component YwqK of YwqJK toxin-antitoxin module